MSEPLAVILAGGLGTRLRPKTLTVPKPMVPVAGKPFLEHQLIMLEKQRVKKILILAAYLGEQIKDYFGNGRNWGLSIDYSFEPQPLGTGGALKLAQGKLSKIFFLINGDSYLPANYPELSARFKKMDVWGLIAVYDNRQEATGVPGNVTISSPSTITAYAKNPKEATPFVDAGVSCFTDDILGLIPANRAVSLEEEIYPVLIKQRRLAAAPVSQRFFDIGTPERLGIFENYLGVRS